MSEAQFAQPETVMLKPIALLVPDPTPQERLRSAEGTRPILAEMEETAEKLRPVLIPSIKLAHKAVDFPTAGSSAARGAGILGRNWRDVGSLLGRLAHRLDSAAINYGLAYLGHAPAGVSR